MRRIQTFRAGQCWPANPAPGQAFVHYDGHLHVWDIRGGSAREAADMEADPDVGADFVGKRVEGSGRVYWIEDQ